MNQISTPKALKSEEAASASITSYFRIDSPIPCTTLGYRVNLPTTTSNSVFSSINLMTGDVTVINPDIGYQVEAIGYNLQDSLIYAMVVKSNLLVTIDANGDVNEIGPVANLPNLTYENGAVDANGYYYILKFNTNELYTIDVNPGSATYGQLVDPTNGYIAATAPYYTALTSNLRSRDWVYSVQDNVLYAVANNGLVERIDPVTGVLTTLSVSGGLPASPYDAQYSLNGPFMYAADTVTGEIWQIEIIGNEAFSVPIALQETDLLFSDGTSCPTGELLIDFGDAPDTDSLTQSKDNYRTLLASDGPRHMIINELRLGTKVTSEDDAYQSPDALGDDLTQNIPDDGTTLPLPPMFTNAASSTTYVINEIVTNDTGQDANLYAWIDFDQNGIFEANEVFTTVVPPSAAAQTIPMTFTVPAGTPIGYTFARVRLTTDTLVNDNPTGEDTRSYGAASDGEVEDYLIRVLAEDAPVFECSPLGYRVTSEGPGINSALTSINLATGELIEISPDIGLRLNAIGYNVLDDLIYGITSNELVVLDALGTAVSLGPITNLPGTGYNTGTADTSGHLFVTSQDATEFYTIDIDPASATFGELLDPTNGYALAAAPYSTPIVSMFPTADWIYHTADGLIYSVANDGNIYQMDPTTGTAIQMTMLPNPLPGASYGAQYALAGDYMYATNNATGTIYRILLDGTTATYEVFASDSPNTLNDGTSCPIAELNLDFGDAPDTNPVTQAPGNYRTLLASDGPRHVLANALYLGAQVTAEIDAYESVDALGDDQTQGIQDDALSTPLTPLANNASSYSFDATVLNDTGSDANFYAWVDFNQDGTFDVNESFVTTVASSAAPQTIPVTINVPGTTPLPLAIGNTYVRLRLTTEELTTSASGSEEDERSYGPARDGEVEDYLLEIIEAALDTTKSASPEFADIGDTVTYTVTLTNPSAIPITDVTFTDAIPDGMTYADNLSITGAPAVGTDPMTGLNFPSIEAGQTVTISWDVTVTSFPETNPTANTGLIDIPNVPVTTTPTVTVNINGAELSPVTKQTDRTSASVGDIITYGISFTNSGSVDAENVIINDILPTGTLFVPGSIMANAAYTQITPDLTLQLTDPVAAGATVTLLFQIEVTEDTINPIINQATVDYEYVVDPNEAPITASADSNEVETAFSFADLSSIAKSVDATAALPGQILTYTATFSNAGTVEAYNVTLNDPTPAGTTLVADSITSTAAYTIDPLSPDIALVFDDPVQPNETITVTYQLLVLENAEPIISNTATLDYTYNAGPDTPADGTASSDPVEIPFINLQADITKSASTANVVPGDVVTFTFDITNTGNTEIAPLILTDLLATELTFIANSVTIGGTSFPDEDPTTGITIPSLAVQESLEVTFQATVLEGTGDTIENTATADLFVTVDDQTYANPVTTNTVTLGLTQPQLTIFKESMPKTVNLGDVITYTIVVENTGNTPLFNVLFQDVLSPCTEFVDGSFKINETVINNVDLEQGINIGNIPEDASLVITYEAKVISGSCCGTIANSASASYIYILPDHTTGTGQSGPVTSLVDANIANFKQASYNCHFTIPCAKPDMQAIDEVKAEITFNDHYVIPSMQSTSTENQVLSGQTLVAHGQIDALLSYTSSKCSQAQHSASFSFPISSRIILPLDYETGQSIEISGIIESTHFEMINEREGYINFIVLILASTSSNQ